VTSFHHQPEAQHLKSSAIHKLGRPITPSFGVKRTCHHEQGNQGGDPVFPEDDAEIRDFAGIPSTGRAVVYPERSEGMA